MVRVGLLMVAPMYLTPLMLIVEETPLVIEYQVTDECAGLADTVHTRLMLCPVITVYCACAMETTGTAVTDKQTLVDNNVWYSYDTSITRIQKTVFQPDVDFVS